MNSSSRKAKFVFVQALTLGRVPLILTYVVIALAVETRHSDLWFTVALAFMVVAAVTDLFDGYFARRFEVVSRLGAYADPLTDKIFYLTTFPTLVFLAAHPRQAVETVGPDLGNEFHGKFLLVLAILFLLRDQWVSFLRSLGALHAVDARANWSGKLRTVVSFPLICLVFYYLQAPAGGIWEWLPIYRCPLFVHVAEGLGLAVNLISIWIYTRYYWPCLRKELRLPDRPV